MTENEMPNHNDAGKSNDSSHVLKTDKRRAKLSFELDEMIRQQKEAHENAVYTGWTAEERAVYYAREGRITALRTQLEMLVKWVN
jgi:hypothetical protein